MRIIGIIGGVAAERALVAGQFARLGAGVLDADRAGHEVLRLPQVEAAARRRWGEAVFGPDGRIDRARLARVVFAPGPEAEQERKYLEQLTHPEIAGSAPAAGRGPGGGGRPRSRSWTRRCCWRRAGMSGAKKWFLSMRRGRCGWRGQRPAVGMRRILRPVRALRNRWTRKRARADVIIDNSGSPQRTQAQVEQFWASLVR